MALLPSAIFASTADAAAPIACFTQTPATAVVGQAVTFDSTCSRDQDAGGRIASRAWDLDNDGSFDDGTGVTASRTFTSAGSFTVRLRVRDGANNSDTETKTVVVNAPPVASFTSSPAAPSTGTAVTFTSTSTDSDGTIASQAWDLDNDGLFDDGTAASVSQTFATPGDKTVKLLVTDNRGTQDTETKTIAIANRAPTVAITSDPASPLSGQTFTLTASAGDPDGSVASYAWDVDGNGTDNFTAGTATKTASFATPGTYPLKVRVTDNSGAATVATLNLAVASRAPTANFTFAPVAPEAFNSVTFTSTSTDSDGTIASQAWDLDNDGAFDDGTAVTATRSFPAAGDYTVRLRVVDSSGTEAITSKSVRVAAANIVPTADFTVSPAAPKTGEMITFTSTSSDPDGTIVSQSWDLDDDGGYDDGTAATVSRSFSIPEDRTVRLRVVDNKGAVKFASKKFAVVNRPPVASLTTDPAAPLAGQEVTFTSTSTDPDGTIASVAWALDADGVFDDGTTAAVKRTFTVAGDYPVKLRVRDNKGAETILTQTVRIGNQPPVAAFSFSPAAPVAGEEVTLTSAAADPDGTIALQQWDLDGDGEFDDSTGPTASVTFSAGAHVVGLRVTDDEGATDSATQTIDVAEPLEPARSTPDQTFDISIPVVNEPPAVPTVPTVPPAIPPRYLDPFPSVRIRGRTTPSGVRLSLFSVRAPAGSEVELRCTGKGCPAKSVTTKVKTRKGAAAGTTRIKRFERSLRAGIVLRVYVTSDGLIGKYTSIKIRRLALPIRQDRCLMPGSSRPVGCPRTP